MLTMLRHAAFALLLAAPSPAVLAADQPITPAAVALLEQQPRLLAGQLDRLAPQRRGIIDLYMIAFGGDAVHDVFLKEVRSARALFDRRFDTRDRSVIMANNRHGAHELPLASVENLRAALRAVGRTIDPEEDVVFLYLTSHGSPKQFISVFSPHAPLADLHARELRALLDESGIRWRVVVVSACYSGSFVDALKDDRTLVITAASKHRASFGCSNEDDYTYFGDAYLNRALRQEFSFIDAFVIAKDLVAEREKQEQLRPSRPQIAMGNAITAKLDDLEQRLRRLASGE